MLRTHTRELLVATRLCLNMMLFVARASQAKVHFDSFTLHTTYTTTHELAFHRMCVDISIISIPSLATIPVKLHLI